MRLLAILLIGIIALGGVIDACAEAHADHADHADLACLDDCCQPIYTTTATPALIATLAVCDRLTCVGGCLNDSPPARSHFRPPEVA